MKLNVSNVVRMFGFNSVDEHKQLKSVGIEHSVQNEDMLLEINNSLITVVARLKTKLYKKQIENQSYKSLMGELTGRLDMIENNCNPKDKENLKELRCWMVEQKLVGG